MATACELTLEMGIINASIAINELRRLLEPPCAKTLTAAQSLSLRVEPTADGLRYQLTAAKFPIHRDLLGFVWEESPLPPAQVQQLASAAFMEHAHNLILVGGTGSGKSHVATALGVAAIHTGKRVRFYLCPVGTMLSTW